MVLSIPLIEFGFRRTTGGREEKETKIYFVFSAVTL